MSHAHERICLIDVVSTSSQCKCKDCGFCQASGGALSATPTTSGEQAAATHSGALSAGGASTGAFSTLSTPAQVGPQVGPVDSSSCASSMVGDVNKKSCDRFCNKAGGVGHCAWCKCQACSFCTGVCNSGLLGDSTFASCEPDCDPGARSDHCRYCRCQGCKFCAAPLDDGDALSAGALEHGAACTSFATGDLEFESCDQLRCSTMQDACETCRCKLCASCGGTVPDATVESVDGGGALSALPSMTKPVVVTLVTERAKGKHGGAAAAAQQTGTLACTSRWIDDVSTPECQQFCDATQGRIHCSLCKCASCSFCSASPPPPTAASLASTPPSIGTATVGRAPCSSPIIGDSTVRQCSFVCSLDFAPAMCLMCKCSACEFCMERARRSADDPPTAAGAGSGPSTYRPPPPPLPHPPPPRPPACKPYKSWDYSYEACVGSCDPNNAAVRCKECKCRACSFCAAHQPPSSQKLSSKRPKSQCGSGILGDALVGGCAPWCLTSGGSPTASRTSTAPRRSLATGATPPAGTKAAFPGTCALCACRECPGMCPPGPKGYGLPLRAPMAPADRNTCILGAQLLLTKAPPRETGFEARILLSEWAEGASLTVIFKGQSPVTVLSAAGARVVDGMSQSATPSKSSAASGGTRVTFILDAAPEIAGPPKAFSFQAKVRSGMYDVSQPAPKIECTVTLAPSPSPPLPSPPPLLSPPSPPPSPPLPPSNTCALGLAYALASQWAGGFRATVMVAVWVPETVVRLDFSSTRLSDGAAFSTSVASHAKVVRCELRPGSDMQCEFALGSAPDSKHGFDFVAHGGGAAILPPTLSCDSVRTGGHAEATGLSPATLNPPLPPMSVVLGGMQLGAAIPMVRGATGLANDAATDPALAASLAACRLGAVFSVRNVWNGGYRAAVRIGTWVARAQVVVSLAPAQEGDRFQLLNAYGAHFRGANERDADGDNEGSGRHHGVQRDAKPRERAQSELTFELSESRVTEYDGFGFTARGAPPPLEAVEVHCPSVTASMLLSPPPPPDCTLGAEFVYVDHWPAGFEAEVRVREWRAGARFVLDFASAGMSPLRLINSQRAVADTPIQLAGKGSKSASGLPGSASSANEDDGTRQVAVRLLPLDSNDGGDEGHSFRITTRFDAVASPAGTPNANANQLAQPFLSCSLLAPISVPPPPVLRGTGDEPPDAPQRLHVASASCASISLTWDPPVGSQALEYRVWASRGAFPAVVVKERVEKPHVELTGMLAATTYSFAVQARSRGAWSALSVAAYGTTDPALRTPSAPYDVPKAASAASSAARLAHSSYGVAHASSESVRNSGLSVSHACPRGLLLALPSLRGGCSGDEWMEVEMRRVTDSHGPWTSAAAHVVAEEVFLSERLLAPRVAYSFRTVAHNGKGASPPGPPSEPLIAHHAVSAAVRQPVVVPTSSSTIRIFSWATSGHASASPGSDGAGRDTEHARDADGERSGHGESAFACDVDAGVRYEVLLKHEQADAEWHTLLQVPPEGATLPIEVGSAACGAGCHVRLRALNISGWEGYSHPSSRTSTPPAPRAKGSGAARIEVRLQSPLAGGGRGRAEGARSFLDALARVTGVPPERLDAIETSTTGQFVTFDVLPPPGGNRARSELGEEPIAEASVDRTLEYLVARPEVLIRLPNPIDPRFGVRRQPEPGAYDLSDPRAVESEQLLEGGASDAYARPTEHRARQLTLLLLGVLFAIVCCWRTVFSFFGELLQLSVPGTDTHPHQPVDVDDDDDELD